MYARLCVPLLSARDRSGSPQRTHEPKRRDAMEESETPGARSLGPPGGPGARRRRSDAEQNYAHIVETAVRLLKEDPDVGLDAIAASAGLGRATVYRHFRGRRDDRQAPGRAAGGALGRPRLAGDEDSGRQ